jgi:PleD family two-component response regulator
MSKLSPVSPMAEPGIGPAPRSRILAAVIPDRNDRMERVLSGHDVTFVKTSNEARSLLEQEEYGLVILGVHFDESQMFSLLGDIRAHARYRKVPILCVLGSRGRYLGDVAIEGLDHAVKAMMANGLLNLENINDDEEGNARVRRIVDYLILLDGELQQVAKGAERNEVGVGSGRLLGEPRRRSSDSRKH